MPTSCREQLRAAIEAKLAAIAGMADRVDRQRQDTVDTADVPLLLVYDAGQAPGERVWTGEEASVLSIRVEAYATGSDPKAASQAADDLVAKARAAVMSDRGLDGLARDVEVGADPEPDGEHPDCADAVEVAQIVFLVSYANREGDPYAFA